MLSGSACGANRITIAVKRPTVRLRRAWSSSTREPTNALDPPQIRDHRVLELIAHVAQTRQVLDREPLVAVLRDQLLRRVGQLLLTHGTRPCS